MQPQLYRIWSFEHDAWWAPGERGYVEDFHSAGEYKYEDALRITRGANYAFNNGLAEMPNEAMVPIVSSSE